MASGNCALELSDEERAELKALATRRKTAQALALRARIVLACAEGGQNTEVAARLGLDRATVGKWRRRFVERRVDGLHDEPRSGAPRTIDDARIEAVIVSTLESLPGMPPIGVRAAWQRPAACRSQAYSASGGPLGCSRTAWRRSSSRPTRTSWPRCVTSSAFMSRHRSTPSFFAWMRSPNSSPGSQSTNVADAARPARPQKP